MTDFWNENADVLESDGSGYLSKDEKQALVASSKAFAITNVKFDPENMYKGQKAPRYLCTVVLTDPTTGDEQDRILALGQTPGSSRDKRLQAMIDRHFGAGETEPIMAVLGQVGNFYTIDPA